MEQSLRKTTNAVASFYCEEGVPAKKDPRSIFGRLIQQLVSGALSANDDALKLVLKLHKSHKWNDNRFPSRIRELTKEFVSILEKLSHLLPRLYLLVDGIDECEERVDLLLGLQRLAEIGTINVFVASRPETDIKESFNNKRFLEMDENQVQMDIARHVDWVLENEKFQVELDESLKDEIRVRILNKSQGMLTSILKLN